MTARRLPDFIEAFSDFTTSLSSPAPFRLWTGIWLIGAACERKVWINNARGQIFPNMFILLVAPPGIGKSAVIRAARPLIGSLGDKRIGASSITVAALADQLKRNQRTIINPLTQKAEAYNCANILSSEFSVLIPQYNTDILGKLTDIYDGDYYGEERRSGQGEHTFDLDKVLATLLAATAPGPFFAAFPESAWTSGFMSRMMVVWSTEIKRVPLFGGETVLDAKMQSDLMHDMKLISKLQGEWRLMPGAIELIEAWDAEHHPHGGSPLPSHHRLMNYATRRTAHLLKLMLVGAISRDAINNTIDEKDFVWAYETLIAMEAEIPSMFKADIAAGDVQVVKDLHHYLGDLYIMGGNKPVPAYKVHNYLAGKLQAYKVNTLIETAVNGGWIKVVTEPGKGKCYIPLATTPEEGERKMKEG